MSETGKNIVNGFGELRRFCQQVSVLLKTVDSLMDDKGWIPIPRVSVVGNTSGSLDFPKEWLPDQFGRFYKNCEFAHLLAYVVVLVGNVHGDEPIEEALLSAGLLEFDRETGVLWNGDYWMRRWHLWISNRDDTGKLCFQCPRNDWPPDEPTDVVRATTLAVPLDEVTNAETLNEKILRPLLAEACTIRQLG